jgi:hypothetical protein
MRALTLSEPWASFVALGLKRVETRNWKNAYRGPMMIHAGRDKSWTKPEYVHELCERAGLPPAQFEGYEWPYGKVLATVDLLDCRPTESFDVLAAQEHALGDYSPGRFGFVLGNLWKLPEPLAARGALGLWRPPAELVEDVAAQRELAAAASAPANGNGSPRPLLAETDLTAVLAAALDWSAECGLKGDIDAQGPERENYPREGHGWVVTLRERTGERRLATARFTSDGRRSMWTVDGKGGPT